MTQAEDHSNNDKANDAQSVSPSLTTTSGLIGLQLGAVFALSFSLIGYPIALSLFLGTVAGVASAALVKWWQIDDDEEEALKVSFSDEEIYGLRKRNRRSRQKRYLTMRNRYRTRRERKALTSMFFETGGNPNLSPTGSQGGAPPPTAEGEGDNEES